MRARVNGGLFSVVVGAREWFPPVALLEGENIIEFVAVDYSDNVSESVQLQYDYFPPDLTNDHFVNDVVRILEHVLLREGQSRVFLTRGSGDLDIHGQMERYVAEGVERLSAVVERLMPELYRST